LTCLQAFVDDSASDVGDRRLFMAGYLNTARNWTLFEAAWRDELRAAPALHYLRMVEANSLRGEFDGWTAEARTEKLRGLARVIRHFKPLLSFEVSVSRDQYYQLVRPVAPRALGNPHFVSSFCVLSSVARCSQRRGATTPIKFVFDEQDGVSADLGLFFATMSLGLPRKARALISGMPAFENDKLFPPLQAADMLAWHIRREYEQLASEGRLGMADLLRNADGHLISSIDKTYLQSWAEKFGRMPGVSGTQSKSQWRALKKEMAQLSATGFVPPYGSRWRNMTYPLRRRLAQLVWSVNR
jgi:hypothetical protein